MKIHRQIWITTITAIVAGVASYASYGLYANAYDNRSGTFDAAFDGYHGEMNDYFNTKLEKLVKIVDEHPDSFTDEKDFKVPTNIDVVNDPLDTVLDKCGENVSGYCVSMGALSRYMNYAKQLEQLGKSLPPVKAGETASQLLNRTYSQGEKVKTEAEQAKMVMEATVNTYNEFVGAYPMHKKYQVIMKDLLKYKLALKTIKNRVTRFPGKFIDSTSSQCE